MSSLPAVARCAIHPEREAVATCSRCGNYACPDCRPSAADNALCVTCEALTGASRYHVVPVKRFVILTVLTFGLYQLNWMYRCWVKIKAAERSQIWPAPRALFSGLTYFLLVSDINDHPAPGSSLPKLSAWLGVGYFVTSATIRLPDALWLISSLNVLFVVPAVRRAWLLSNEQARASSQWAGRHTALAIFGAVFFGLAVLGTFMET